MFSYTVLLLALLVGTASAFTMPKLPMRSMTMTATETHAQSFLEFEPYHSRATLPLNTFNAKEPHTGKIVSVKRIVGPDATGETCDIIIDHGGKMPYIEGQSYGVIPPGTNPKNGKPFTNRLYSIASTRYGDDMKVRHFILIRHDLSLS
jgi:ferredoxin--NADP+ reductase